MKKKLLYLFLVFVSMFFASNVSADKKTTKTCEYEYAPGELDINIRFKMEVYTYQDDDKYAIARASDSDGKSIYVANWNEGNTKYTKYSGKKGMEKTDQCPQYAVYSHYKKYENKDATETVYLTDDASDADKINKALENEKDSENPVEAYFRTTHLLNIDESFIKEKEKAITNRVSSMKSSYSTLTSIKCFDSTLNHTDYCKCKLAKSSIEAQIKNARYDINTYLDYRKKYYEISGDPNYGDGNGEVKCTYSVENNTIVATYKNGKWTATNTSTNGSLSVNFSSHSCPETIYPAGMGSQAPTLQDSKPADYGLTKKEYKLVNKSETKGDEKGLDDVKELEELVQKVESEISGKELSKEKDGKTDCSTVEPKPKKDYKVVCGVLTENAQKFIYRILDWIKYIALVLAIGLSVLDFFKAVASEEDDAFTKAAKKFGKRLIVVVILFLLPVILEFVLKLVHIQGVDSSNPMCK